MAISTPELETMIDGYFEDLLTKLFALQIRALDARWHRVWRTNLSTAISNVEQARFWYDRKNTEKNEVEG